MYIFCKQLIVLRILWCFVDLEYDICQIEQVIAIVWLYKVSKSKCVKLKPMQLYCYFYLLLLNKILWKQILFMFFQVLLTANIKSLNSYKKILSHWILYVPIACFDWKKKWEKKILNFFFLKLKILCYSKISCTISMNIFWRLLPSIT